MLSGFIWLWLRVTVGLLCAQRKEISIFVLQNFSWSTKQPQVSTNLLCPTVLFICLVI